MVSTPPEHILPLNVLSLPKQIHSIKVTFAVFELFTLLAISVIFLFYFFFYTYVIFTDISSFLCNEDCAYHNESLHVYIHVFIHMRKYHTECLTLRKFITQPLPSCFHPCAHGGNYKIVSVCVFVCVCERERMN